MLVGICSRSASTLLARSGGRRWVSKFPKKCHYPNTVRCISSGKSSALSFPTAKAKKDVEGATTKRNSTTAATQGYELPIQVIPFTTSTSRRPDVELKVVWPGGKASNFNWFYLRDHCPCQECRHPETKQRLLNTFAIPTDIGCESFKQGPDGIRVVWTGDAHESFYPWHWLRTHLPRQPQQDKLVQQDVRGNVQKVSLFGSEIESGPPIIDYDYVMNSEDGVRDWTALIQQYGFSYVDGCPPTPEATDALLKRIAFIRETHYGAFWDFTADLASKDTAYTSLPLGAHTDTTYFSDPAGLQMFHLLSHTEGKGGASLLVDGYNVFNILQEEAKQDSFSVDPLKGTIMEGHASGNLDSNLRANYVVCSGDVPKDGDPLHPFERPATITWNNDDRASMVGAEPGEITAWYEAARRWNDILTRPSSEYWAQLKPGRPLVFNNHRVLHGRSAFTGKRRMCGGYVNMDDFLSRWRTLNFKREDLLNRT